MGFFSVDEGKIALRRYGSQLDHLRHSFSVGLTVRAGGLPVFYLLFAWGGNEGNHTTATISPTLLRLGQAIALLASDSQHEIQSDFASDLNAVFDVGGVHDESIRENR